MSSDRLPTLKRMEAVLKRRLRQRRRAVTLAIILLLSPVLALFAYAGAARWLLSGPRLRAWINDNPESLTLNYDDATSFWPGRIAIRNLMIRGSDRNVEWMVRLADARVEYSVLALAARTFRCTRLGGTGLAFRLRTRIEPGDLGAADVSVLPSIPGFSDPPVRAHGEVVARSNEAKKNPWRVDVRAIQIEDFDEIWIDASHWRGAARVAGSFFLRPGLLAAIGPARVDFERGTLRLGRSPVGLTASGSVLATFAPYEPFAVHGSEVWQRVSGDVDLEMGFDDLRALEYLSRSAPATRLEGGSGTTTVHGTIARGIAKGEARVAIQDGTVRLKNVTLTGDAELAVAVPSWNLVSGPLDVSGSRIAFTDVKSAGSEASRNWWGRFEISSGRIDSVSSATVRARSRDARPLLAVIGVDLPDWTRGLLSLEDFSATANVAIGQSIARVSDFDARGGDFRILGTYLRNRRARSGAFLIESGILRLGLDIRSGATKIILFGPKKWYRDREARETSSSGEAGSKIRLADIRFSPGDRNGRVSMEAGPARTKPGRRRSRRRAAPTGRGASASNGPPGAPAPSP